MREICTECGEIKEVEEVLFQSYFAPPEHPKGTKMSDITDQEAFELVRGEGAVSRLLCEACKTLLIDVFEFPLYEEVLMEEVTEEHTPTPFTGEQMEEAKAQLKTIFGEGDELDKAMEALEKQQKDLLEANEKAEETTVEEDT